MPRPGVSTLLILPVGVGAHLLLCAAPVLLIGRGAVLLEAQVLAVLGLLSLWVAGEAVLQPRGVRSARPAGRAEAVPLAILSVVWVAFVQRAMAGGSPHWMAQAGGFAAAAIGIWLRLVAIRTLGDRFLDQVDLLPGHRLEQRGVYRLLRHPAESGNVLIACGCAAALDSWAGLLVALGGVAPLAVRRMLREELLLRPLRGGACAPRDDPVQSPAARPAPFGESNSCRSLRRSATARAVSG